MKKESRNGCLRGFGIMILGYGAAVAGMGLGTLYGGEGTTRTAVTLWSMVICGGAVGGIGILFGVAGLLVGLVAEGADRIDGKNDGKVAGIDIGFLGDIFGERR